MSVVNVSTYLITSITANPFEFPTILVTMSVLILTTVVNLLYMSTLRVRIPLRPGVLDTTLCAKVCHDLGSSVGLSGYSDHHNITEILLKVALNPITLTLYMSKTLQDIPPSTTIVSCIKCQKLVKTSLPRQRLSLVSNVKNSSRHPSLDKDCLLYQMSKTCQDIPPSTKIVSCIKI